MFRISEKSKVSSYKDKKYTILHRLNGPAIKHSNGTKEWYLNGNLHREDSPAIEYSYGVKEWFFYGKLHRVDGSAIEWKDNLGADVCSICNIYYYLGEKYLNIKNDSEWIMFVKTLILQ